MAQDDKNKVTTQTMVVAVVVALVVGFFGGVIYSSIRGEAISPVATGAKEGSPIAGGQQGQTVVNQQLASTILSLEQKVATNPKDADAWVQLGNSYFDSNNFVKAIDAYNHYLTLQPNNANVLTDLGTMYRNNGQPKEAIAAFDRAMAVDPKHVQAPFNKGIVLLNDLHDPQGAIAVLQKLVDANPNATAANGMPISQVIEAAKKQLAAGGH
jgi:cytochrome c-type biogenesis protein CcmH/NrfG